MTGPIKSADEQFYERVGISRGAIIRLGKLQSDYREFIASMVRSEKEITREASERLKDLNNADLTRLREELPLGSFIYDRVSKILHGRFGSET